MTGTASSAGPPNASTSAPVTCSGVARSTPLATSSASSVTTCAPDAASSIRTTAPGRSASARSVGDHATSAASSASITICSPATSPARDASNMPATSAAVDQVPADPDPADLVRDRRETIGLDRRVVLDPHPEQVADRRRGLARRELEGVAERSTRPGRGSPASAAGGTTSAPLVPNPVLPTTTGSGPPSVVTTRSARPDGRGRRDLGLGAGAFARDQERARRRGREDGDEHKERQPTRHRYRAAFSM